MTKIDAWLVAVGIAFAAPTIGYPFSRDQALFYYVGREWALRGALPYRDTFEVKSPFIYALHALLVLLFGEHMWAIRVAEIFAVLAIGTCGAFLATPRWNEPPRGTIGAAVLATSVLYFGWFSFEDTANCEIWCVLFVLASAVAAQRVRSRAGSALSAGVWMGVALLAKPPCATLVALPLVHLYARRNLRSLVAFSQFAMGVMLPILATTLIFAAWGGLGALLDIEFGFLRHYIQTDHPPLTFHEIEIWTLWQIDWFSPWSYAALALLLAALVSRQKSPVLRRYVGPVVLGFLVWIAVLMQRRFFPYYFGLALAPIAILAASGWIDLTRRRKWLRAMSIAWPVVFATTALTMVPHDVYMKRAAHVLAWVSHPRSERGLLEGFASPVTHVDLAQSHDVATWISEHASASDTLLVRGYSPEIYALSGLHYTGRFFWSVALTNPHRAYHREEWLAEDRAEIDRRPPHWVVARDAPDPEIDSATSFAERGYVARTRIGPYVVMEAGTSQVRAPR